jgi:hypothetical protein
MTVVGDSAQYLHDPAGLMNPGKKASRSSS